MGESEKPAIPRRGTVLIVEDDVDIRDGLRDVLEDEGYGVITASNGREGLDLLARTDVPCLILLDLMMPVMNGLDFLAAKQAHDVIAPIPVVIVSAYENIARAAVGASGFVRKPVNLDLLLGEVQKHCSARCAGA